MAGAAGQFPGDRYRLVERVAMRGGTGACGLHNLHTPLFYGESPGQRPSASVAAPDPQNKTLRIDPRSGYDD